MVLLVASTATQLGAASFFCPCVLDESRAKQRADNALLKSQKARQQRPGSNGEPWRSNNNPLCNSSLQFVALGHACLQQPANTFPPCLAHLRFPAPALCCSADSAGLCLLPATPGNPEQQRHRLTAAV